MAGMTSLSNRDCAALLRQWGFEEIGYNGGHLVMEREGRKVQITAPSRSTPTPYKALRKAAKIVGVTLQDFLAGPKREKKEMPKAIAIRPIAIEQTKEEEVTVTVNDIEPVTEDEPRDLFPTDSTLVCPVCQKSGFKTQRGFSGHLRAHEQVLCNSCGKEFSRQGIGPHSTSCGPKKRKPGRPRHPIAEEIEGGRRRKVKDLGVEVPILDTFEDDEFPDVAAFAPPPVNLEDASLKAAFQLILPDLAMTEERFASFKSWVETSRTLFNS